MYRSELFNLNINRFKCVKYVIVVCRNFVWIRNNQKITSAEFFLINLLVGGKRSTKIAQYLIEYGKSYALLAACAGNASAFFRCLRGNFEKGVVCLLQNKATVECSHCVSPLFLDNIVVSFIKDKAKLTTRYLAASVSKQRRFRKRRPNKTSHDFPLSSAKPSSLTSDIG